MAPSQFWPRGQNWECLVKTEHPIKQVLAKFQRFGQLPNHLFAVTGALFVLENVPMDEPAGFPITADFDFLDLLLAEAKDLSEAPDQRLKIGGTLPAEWNEFAAHKLP